MADESLAEMYYESLRSTTKPVAVLVAFYSSIFDLTNNVEVLYSVFSRLYKIYGRELVYFAILDCADVSNFIPTDDPVRLLSFFAKKRLANKVNFDTPTNLNSMAKQMLKHRKTKLKVPKIFEDKNSE